METGSGFFPLSGGHVHVVPRYQFCQDQALSELALPLISQFFLFQILEDLGYLVEYVQVVAPSCQVS